MRPLTPADVARRPLPGATVPLSVRFSPDGSWVTFLAAEPGSLRQALVAVDVATGERREVEIGGAGVDEEGLGLEERLRRERARSLALGVTRYAWADGADRLLVPMSDGIWVLDGVEATPRRVVDADASPAPLLDAQISADGSTVGWVCDDEVHVVAADGGDPVQVTAGARGTGRTHGLAEFVAQEEMGRPYGFWLSPDGSQVAYCEVDETHIPVYRIVHQGSDRVGPDAQEDHRYPFAGADNARVRLAVVPADGSGASAPRWLDLGCTGIGPDRYLARVQWDGPDHLVVQVQNRGQDRLDLVRFDVREDAAPEHLLTETSSTWINLHDLLRPLGDGSFLWASERTGFRHLEVRDADGGLRRELTSGEWVVTGLAGVGDREVWFVSTQGGPLERHVWCVPLDGSAPPRQVSEGPGVHQAVAHVQSEAWIDVHSTLEAPPVAHLRRSDGAPVLIHDGADDPVVAELALTPPDLRTVTADDGTTLHAAVYRPEGEGPFPTVLWVYGGPHVQQVTRSWDLTRSMRAQFLRQEGFCVAVVDNRGSANRGLHFEGALHRRMGTVEVDDQVALVTALVADGLADPDRVGMYGWSYGGYLSAMCLARRPDVFTSACAGAPVTSWDGYDTHYTERYMGTPQENPDGYRDGAVATHVAGLAGRHLLLIHGLLDENVHFRHTARLVSALIHLEQTETVDHRLLLYPDERHMPRAEADRISMEHHVIDFFDETLVG